MKDSIAPGRDSVIQNSMTYCRDSVMQDSMTSGRDLAIQGSMTSGRNSVMKDSVTYGRDSYMKPPQESQYKCYYVFCRHVLTDTERLLFIVSLMCLSVRPLFIRFF